MHNELNIYSVCMDPKKGRAYVALDLCARVVYVMLHRFLSFYPSKTQLLQI